MLDLLLDPGFWAALFSVTLVQIALGADNLIVITIFILLLMFSVDFYQNWLERKREQHPVELRRRKK